MVFRICYKKEGGDQVSAIRFFASGTPRRDTASSQATYVRRNIAERTMGRSREIPYPKKKFMM